MAASERILIVGPSWVGDMVMAQSLFKVLRQQYSDAAIDVLAPAWSRPITERMPEVAASIDMPVGHGKVMLKARWQLARSLAKHNYSRAYVLPNSLKSALIPAFAGIPVRVGWRGEMRYGLLNDIRKLDPIRYPLMVQRFTALAYAPGAYLPKPPEPRLVAQQDSVESLRERYGVNLKKPVLSLCPGAEFGPAKQWPAPHYAEVAKQMIARGWQVWIFGSAKDQPVAAEIAQLLATDAPVVSLAGKTTLADAIDLMSLSSAAVSNDSGLMHIAAALGLPLVGVYGSTSPGFTPPLGDAVATASLTLDCQPCFARECPLGHKRCLHDLPPAAVLAQLDRLLADNKGSVIESNMSSAQ
ncbi:lipopolysaccharide heptosyltransferase II [Gilvimarinus sp. DA14]|uniref:lipopolysaccharide heptosyltransferase II n=1 Tax=Gilvimarinus sp. DA14 TaxID=2956798 RepID=UPI0020B74597|nr:lipopolysaccharide heptosyltransferase II [Gilvimarinus sp. DA14]UTF61678.1 lipopolysaccharide heptosyltransferase II [Gilvimarinus sp. DA14]